MRFLSAILAMLVYSGAAWASDSDLAYFQTQNIYHSGLVGSHTLALTFDDGPNVHTRNVLDALNRYGIKATFFIVGGMAKLHPNMLAAIAADGHLLANHSATHPKLGSRYDLHPELLIAQIRQTHDLIAPLQAKGDPLFFRAPYGLWRSEHAAILNADPVLKKYVGPIYWDIGGHTHVDDRGYVQSSADWNCWQRGWSGATCAKGYIREIEKKDGGIVLMHCIRGKSGELLDAMLPVLIAEGFKFVRLDAVREFDRYQTPPEPLVAMTEKPRLH